MRCRVGGEQLAASKADPLDQPPHEHVCRHLLQRAAAARYSFRKAWMRSRASGGSWGLSIAASSADTMSSLRRRAISRAPGQVDRAQLHRRAGQRPDRGRRVVGVGEHPQPRDRVADLGAMEERRSPGEPVGDVALLERCRDQPALSLARRRPGRTRPRGRQRPPQSRCSISRAAACASARALLDSARRAARRRRPRGGDASGGSPATASAAATIPAAPRRGWPRSTCAQSGWRARN